ncbi:D-sedoheptulose 7-phosphate isomerase [Oleiagrimonas citrea]|uniref:Phosphoheptose isomerase n=2 Tax=Oleiagrimonas citrea TaxID=1665687 RepID=A0A846ZKR1_9GAMM|nr:D-sedoheptulose 7-phosphate isomerase [Oleiagrimonas citrea]
MTQFIRQELSSSLDLVRKLSEDNALHRQIEAVVGLCTRALRAEKKILFAGNGGSAADAQHWAGELVSRFYFDRPGLPGIALTTDSSILTAIGNDYGYDYVFARQVEALGCEGDVFFAISTSGNSANILRAIHAAKERGITVVGFTGAGGGNMLEHCDECFRMPSDSTPKIQEGHELLGHMICALIEKDMFGHDRD